MLKVNFNRKIRISYYIINNKSIKRKGKKSKYRDFFSIFTNSLKKIKELYFLFTLAQNFEIYKKVIYNFFEKSLTLKFEIIIKHIHFIR